LQSDQKFHQFFWGGLDDSPFLLFNISIEMVMTCEMLMKLRVRYCLSRKYVEQIAAHVLEELSFATVSPVPNRP
jgi:hypothetical protein